MLGREIMRERIILCLMLSTGIAALAYGLYIGVMIGANWFGEDAQFQWHMNNYIVIDGVYAYSVFGLATLAIGGLATGIAMAAFFDVSKTKKHLILLASAFFVAIIMTGLGFNTLDFMLGSFYWTNMQYPPPVQVPLLGSVDIWNFYFYLFVAPLWTGGFIMGLSASHYVFIFQPQRVAVAYIAKKNFTRITYTKPAREFVAESKVLSRNRKETYQRTN